MKQGLCEASTLKYVYHTVLFVSQSFIFIREA